MSYQQDDFSEFKSSRRNAREYPLNLVRSQEFDHSLTNWHTSLDDNEEDVFLDLPSSIRLWECHQQRNAFCPFDIKTMNELKKALPEMKTDPLCRFMCVQTIQRTNCVFLHSFLRTPSSRSPLACTRDQLTFILSHHQVAASIVEFILTFRAREDPHSFTSFRYENYLTIHDKQPGLGLLGRSGVLLQHSFNLLGFERVEKRERPWVQRQFAAHHSFDILTGRSLWIIIKGDNLIRERVERATGALIKRRPDAYKSVGNAFSESLRMHLLLFAWVAENLPTYVGYLEKELGEFSAITQYAPIEKLAKDVAALKIVRRVTEDDSQPRQSATYSQHPDSTTNPFIEAVRRATSGISNFSRAPHTISRGNSIPLETQQRAKPVLKIKDLNLEKLMSFNKAQSLSLLKDEVDNAINVIDQDIRLLGDLSRHYQSLGTADDFLAHMTDQTMCQAVLSDFGCQVQRLESDLRNQQGRLQTVLRRLQNIETMFNAILQYQAMQSGESFAKSAKDSADIMEVWTKRMHRIATRTEQETVSMHVITIFTLVFLPGTFVSTVFSSGILSFNDSGNTQSSTNIDGWQTRKSALKLYFIVCVPLMVVTLSAWSIAYFCARRKRKRRDRRDAFLINKESEDETV